jgi:tRNA A37 methylthiotransferase MiaB
MLGALVRDGFRTVGDPDGADVAVINTCAFLQSAVRESQATRSRSVRAQGTPAG